MVGQDRIYERVPTAMRGGGRSQVTNSKNERSRRSPQFEKWNLRGVGGITQTTRAHGTICDVDGARTSGRTLRKDDFDRRTRGSPKNHDPKKVIRHEILDRD